METTEICMREINSPRNTSTFMSAYDIARDQLRFLQEAIAICDKAGESDHTARLVSCLRHLMTMGVSDDISELFSYMIDRLSIRHSSLCVHPVNEVGWLLDNLKTVFSHRSSKNH